MVYLNILVLSVAFSSFFIYSTICNEESSNIEDTVVSQTLLGQSDPNRQQSVPFPHSLRSRVQFSNSESDGYLSPTIRAELATQHAARADLLGNSFRELINNELGVQYMQQAVETAFGQTQTTLSATVLLDHVY